MSWGTDRAEYIAGLRELADRLEKQLDLPLPTHGSIEWLLFSNTDLANPELDKLAEQKLRAARIVKHLGGANKQPGGAQLFSFTRNLGGPAGLETRVSVHREAVCERVVTGTKKTKRWVKDPEQVDQVMVHIPEVEVEVEEEIVEWVCNPLLGESPGQKAITS